MRAGDVRCRLFVRAERLSGHRHERTQDGAGTIVEPSPDAPTAFIDFEASSLSKRSWPVEVAWVFDDGAAESFLIRPAPGWNDWAESAERIHGISRAQLDTEGVAYDIVARRMIERLAGCALYATAPSWDGKWLSVLLRGAGLPRHALRLEDTTVAHRRLVRKVLAQAGVPAAERNAVIGVVLAAAKRQFAAAIPPAHRALADAKAEADLWRLVGRLAREAAWRGMP